jgi:hypothetical protein
MPSGSSRRDLGRLERVDHALLPEVAGVVVGERTSRMLRSDELVEHFGRTAVVKRRGAGGVSWRWRAEISALASGRSAALQLATRRGSRRRARLRLEKSASPQATTHRSASSVELDVVGLEHLAGRGVVGLQRALSSAGP